MFRTAMAVDMLLHSFWFKVFIRLQQKLETLVLVSICMAEQVASFSMYTGLLTI
jgi:hypothetical protein